MKQKRKKRTVPEIVTQKIIDSLEAGVAPWRQCWTSQRPHNLISGKPYTGANALLTHPMVTGFKEAAFLTENQAKKLGGHVREGERYLPVTWFGKHKDKETEKTYSCARYYRVYNVEQIDGLDTKASEARVVQLNPTAESIIESWNGYPATEFGDFDPCYSPPRDTVYMPHAYSFDSDGEYYAALFHEYVHSTGHKSRLARDMRPLMSDRHSYSKEELIAEIGAAFLCHYSGIDKVMENQVAYCQHWLKQLKENPEFILEAARGADKAFRMIIGEADERSQGDKAEEAA